jgi:hypothetical protein
MALTVAIIDDAIERIATSGQSVNVDGVSYTSANIKDLFEIRRNLKSEAGSAFGYRVRPLKPPEH